MTNVETQGQTKITDNRIGNRQFAADAIAFASAEMKIRYDEKHKNTSLGPGDMAFVKLQKGYHLPGLKNARLSNQRASPFRIVEKCGSLAYKLELPTIWKVHPVFSIAMLEPAPKEADRYHRPREEGQEPIINDIVPGLRGYKIENLPNV